MRLSVDFGSSCNENFSVGKHEQRTSRKSGRQGWERRFPLGFRLKTDTEGEKKRFPTSLKIFSCDNLSESFGRKSHAESELCLEWVAEMHFKRTTCALFSDLKSFSEKIESSAVIKKLNNVTETRLRVEALLSHCLGSNPITGARVRLRREA